MEKEIIISQEFELIAQAMLVTRGDLAKASRLNTVMHNAMSLRVIVKDNPSIRNRYHELLAEEMQEKQLHIAERILKMAELQEEAFGGEVLDKNGEAILNEDGEVQVMPSDPKLVIDLSKEISRLIYEGKGQNVSSASAIVLVSKENPSEILAKFLDS